MPEITTNTSRELIFKCRKEARKEPEKRGNVLEDDSWYYFGLGYLLQILTIENSIPHIGSNAINKVLNAKTDEGMKKHLKQYKIREKPMHLYNNWKGVLLDSLIAYQPKDLTIEDDEAHRCALIGFTQWGPRTEEDARKEAKKAREEKKKAKEETKED